MAPQWYKKSFRRNLVDIRIDAWNGEFLSRFDPELCFPCLKKSRIASPIIYTHSHFPGAPGGIPAEHSFGGPGTESMSGGGFFRILSVWPLLPITASMILLPPGRIAWGYSRPFWGNCVWAAGS
jgi:hypothetical protein